MRKIASGDATIQCEFWGRIGYQEAWERQKSLLQKRIDGEIPDTLVFCEHDPVITLGRGAQRDAENFIDEKAGIPVVSIERGGLSTYHGPGQLVVYPIFQLSRKNSSWARSGVVNLIRSMEDWMIDFFASHQIPAEAICEKTGVWVVGEGPSGITLPRERKIASIGIAVKKWVSYHGLALNVSTGAEPWKAINPCGFEAQVMTDLNRELSHSFTLEQVQEQLVNTIDKFFVGDRKGPRACAAG